MAVDWLKFVEWANEGAEPSSTLRKEGFKGGDKPPASVFNYFFNRISGITNQLQAEHDKLKKAVEITTGDLNNYVDVGIFTYSASNSASITNTPEQAQSTMLVLPRLTADDTANRVQLVLTQTNHLYMRHKAEGTWAGWTRLRNSNEVIPVVYGGTGATTVTGARAVFNLPETCVSPTDNDWNNATATGWYNCQNATNAPNDSKAWFFGWVIAHNSNYVLQELYAFTNSSTKVTDLTKYIRSCYMGTWTDWVDVTVQQAVPEKAKLSFIESLTSDAQTQINGKMDMKPAFVELTPAEGSEHGGYIDFHYDGSTDDYTSRIIEEEEGVLLARAIFKAEGDLYENGSNRVYSTGNKPTATDVGAQAIHYYYAPTEFRKALTSTATEIWDALPEHSVFVCDASKLTGSGWNFPITSGIVRIEKYAENRGSIQFFSKVEANKDWRMFLSENTGKPSGVWKEYSFSAYSYGTTDLTAGTSQLETGKLYFVYE